MKQTRRLIAFLLVMAMVCALTGTAFAAGMPTRKNDSKVTESSEIEFQSSEFIQKNLNAYQDTDIVRAIVLLEGRPEIDTALGNLKLAASLRDALKAEHRKVLDLMQSLNFDLAYEFTSLINGFSLDVAYGDLDFIAGLPGVASVHVANYYTVPETRQEQPLSMISGAYTGNIDAAAAGYDGAGQIIAIIDTGLDVSHEAFQDVDGRCAASAVLTEQNRPAGTEPGVYISPKIPFAYDYADNDKNVDDKQGHGTHVSGIAAGYAVNQEEGSVIFQGAAPAAQLLSMKVFPDKQPGTTTDIYFRALEDAYRLGADVINMSLGSIHGFTYDDSLETETFGNIYKKLDEAGIILSVAAGNSGSQADTSTKGYLGVDYNDYGTVGNPSTMDGNLSIASMENARFPLFAIEVNGEYFAYSDSTISAEDETGVWLTTFHDQHLPFVVVPGADGGVGIGTAEELAAVSVKDSVAIVRRGEISFQEKVDNAAAAGAIAVIVCNNEPGLIRMQLKDGGIPAICAVQEAQAGFAALGSGSFFIPGEKVEADNPEAFNMSVFSSWGTTSSLTLDPCLTSFGGNINSAAAGLDHEYVVMSGTSMATPMMTGTIANVLSYLDQSGFTGSKLERAQLAEALLQSSALIVPDGDSIYSVRRQGAGLGNAVSAIQNYKNAGYIVDPLKELGDDPEKTGVYSFDFTLKNTSEETVSYDGFEAYVLADLAANIGSADQPVFANQKKSIPVFAGSEGSGSVSYTMNGAQISALELAAGESATITVTVTLDDDAKAYLDVFPYGAFVEGFVSVRANQKYENHATFLAYYGDWTEAPIMEAADFRDFLDVQYQLTQIPGNEAGDSLADLGAAPLDYLDVHTMPHMAYTCRYQKQEPLYYAGACLYSDKLPFNPDYVSFSTSESERNFSDCLAMLPFLLRNASVIDVTISDADNGQVYASFAMDYNKRAIFDFETMQWQTASYWLWDGTDNDNKMIPSDTRLNIRMDSTLPYGHNGEEGTKQENTWNFDITIDYNVPVINESEIVIDHSAGTMTVTASDSQYLQAILLMEAKRKVSLDDSPYNGYVYAPETAGETQTAVFDIQELLAQGIKKVNVVALDYATNYAVTQVDLISGFKKVPVTLHQPVSEPVQQSVKIGKTFIFPTCEDVVEGAEFECWVVAPSERMSAEEFEQVRKFYPEDQIVVTGSCEYYALYSVNGGAFYTTSATYPQPQNPCYFENFVDCTDEWYHEAVDFMVHNGLMCGVSEDRFAPSDGMTRAMAVQVLYANAGHPAPESESGFEDVAEDSWYAEAVAWARENNIVAGVTDSCFAPEDEITREQIATILWSKEGRPEVSQDLSAFADEEEISDYAVAAMKWAVANGMFSGDNHSCLNPGDTATRAEFAVIMLRYLDGSYECENR